MSRPSPRTVFLEALDQETTDQRDAYLQSACGDDAELRASVESLLDAHDRPANPLDCVPQNRQVDAKLLAETIGQAEHVGMRIGSYRLMEQIGEGGFGEEAEAAAATQSANQRQEILARRERGEIQVEDATALLEQLRAKQ